MRTIRLAVAADAAQACEVIRRAIVQDCARDHANRSATLAAWLANKTPATVAAWFAAPGNHAIVAQSGDAIVGVALLTRGGKLALLYVDPAHTGAGVATALLADLEAQAGRWGIGVLRLDSTVSAAAFFMRRGFQHLGSRRSVFGTRTITLGMRVGHARPQKIPAPMLAGCSALECGSTTGDYSDRSQSQ